MIKPILCAIWAFIKEISPTFITAYKNAVKAYKSCKEANKHK